MAGYFIYCRKSSEAEDRQVLSLESQSNEMLALAAKLDLPILAVLTEAKSAKEPGRSVFNEMMRRLQSGEASGVICWKLDRLARNPIDGGSVIWAIKQRGIRVVTPSQTYAREDDNIILMYIEFGMAQKYVDDLSKNVKRGLKTKLEKGWLPGAAPMGYLNETVKLTGETRIVKDPDRFHLVRRMWDLMLTGLYTPPRIHKIANEQWAFRTRPSRRMGRKPLALSSIYRIFTRPFYYGSYEFPRRSGLWFKGIHEPMVTKAEYDRVQTLLGQKGNPRPRSDLEFVFSGLIRCGSCNALVTAEEKHQLICSKCRFKFAYKGKSACPNCDTKIPEMENPKILKYTYYHCTKSKRPRCREKSLRDTSLEAQIQTFLTSITISAEFTSWALTQIQRLHTEEDDTGNEIFKSQKRLHEECERRLENLIRLKTSPENADGSLFSDEEYAKQRRSLVEQKTITEEVLSAPQNRNAVLSASRATFSFSSRLGDRFRKGNPSTKREILKTIASNLILRDKKLSIQAKEPYNVLRNFLSPPQVNASTFEPANDPIYSTPNPIIISRFASQRGVRDDVRTLEVNAERAAALIYAHFKKEFGRFRNN